MVQDNIHDVEFTDAIEKDSIRGNVLYYSTSQVASMLDIPDSTVRYYSKAFEDILKVEIFNKQRKYTDTTISKLKFIVELKSEGMSIRQINEFCATGVDFNSENGIVIKDSNPMSIQTLSKALLEEQKKQMDDFKEEMFKRVEFHFEELSQQQITHQEKMKESMMEEIAVTVDDVLSDKFSTLENEVKYLREDFKMATVSNAEIEKKSSNNSMVSKWKKFWNQEV